MVVFEPVTSVQIEEAPSDWRSLEAGWHQLWRELCNPTPFQTFAWLSAAARAIAPDDSRLLIARAPDRLVGIFPIAGAETLFLAGDGITDYQDALVAPGFERMVMNAFVEYLRENPHRWTDCDFQNLRPESALLYGDFGAPFSDIIEICQTCPVLNLTGPAGLPTNLPQAVPAHQRDKVRYYSRRAAKLGKIEFESVTWENLQEFLEALFRLHRARWRSRGENGVLDEETIKAFHRAAAPGLLRAETLRMYAMRLNGGIVAIYLGFLCGGRAFYYLSGFDPEISDISPGTLLIAYAIEEAIRESATCFDFLRGAERYKHAWGAHETYTYCRKITRQE
jgi:CelD/BcsL family acetyltransferase involved in cellulose biosynthesis